VEVVARRCDKLERLDVSGPHHLSPRAASTLLALCPRLTELRLYRCLTDLSTHVVVALATCPSRAASRLTVLTLCGMRRITDGIITEHFPSFSGLRSLSLKSCTQITSKGLAFLSWHVAYDNTHWTAVKHLMQKLPGIG
jgi:hypothetical protein